MIELLFIKKDTLEIMAKNEEHSSNLRMPLETYKNLFG